MPYLYRFLTSFSWNRNGACIGQKGIGYYLEFILGATLLKNVSSYKNLFTASYETTNKSSIMLRYNNCIFKFCDRWCVMHFIHNIYFKLWIKTMPFIRKPSHAGCKQLVTFAKRHGICYSFPIALFLWIVPSTILSKFCIVSYGKSNKIKYQSVTKGPLTRFRCLCVRTETGL